MMKKCTTILILVFAAAAGRLDSAGAQEDFADQDLTAAFWRARKLGLLTKP